MNITSSTGRSLWGNMILLMNGRSERMNQGMCTLIRWYKWYLMREHSSAISSTFWSSRLASRVICGCDKKAFPTKRSKEDGRLEMYPCSTDMFFFPYLFVFNCKPAMMSYWGRTTNSNGESTVSHFFIIIVHGLELTGKLTALQLGTACRNSCHLVRALRYYLWYICRRPRIKNLLLWASTNSHLLKWRLP